MRQQFTFCGSDILVINSLKVYKISMSDQLNKYIGHKSRNSDGPEEDPWRITKTGNNVVTYQNCCSNYFRYFERYIISQLIYRVSENMWAISQQRIGDVKITRQVSIQSFLTGPPNKDTGSLKGRVYKFKLSVLVNDIVR